MNTEKLRRKMSRALGLMIRHSISEREQIVYGVNVVNIVSSNSRKAKKWKSIYTKLKSRFNEIHYKQGEIYRRYLSLFPEKQWWNKKMAISLKTYSKTFANRFFKDFLDNPEYRGPTFTWDNFPEMSARMGKAGLFMSYASGNPSKEAEQTVYDLIKEHTEELIKSHKL